MKEIEYSGDVKLSKKNLTVIICAAAAVALAITAVLLIILLGKNKDLENITSSSGFTSATTGVSVEEAVSSEIESTPQDNGIRLVISSPTKKSITTTESTVTFTGSSDKDQPLTLNGVDVERGENGIFTYTANLNVGNNSFTFEHKGEKQTYTVKYRYVIISEYYPWNKQVYSSGSTFGVSALARNGSTVTATFNGQTITLANQVDNEVDNISEIFVAYGGYFTLPGDNYSDLDLGKVTFTATYDGKSETFYSGNIICNRPDFVVDFDPDATPLGNRYINVGSGKITEIIAYEAETFDAYSTDDMSRPTNNYLPKGTVDYSAQGYVYYKDQKEYAILRCGKQVYTSRKNQPGNQVIPVVKEYAGTLPDHNEIEFLSFENGTQHTTLKIKPLWKAPFYFDMLPQSYKNPKYQEYEIDSFTASYIDITFCYATVITGNFILPSDNPLFSSAKIIQNQSDYTLRLYLKKQGAFYGWDANYNENGELVFEFLNPAVVNAADNQYGADLTGVEILIDVGHGGADPGAPGFDVNNHNEAIQNLFLAQKVKSRLESIGAKVVLTRDSNVTSTNDDKIKTLKNLKPDLCLAIHHDSNNSSKLSGFGSYYSQPFSKKAAELIHNHTVNTGLYSKTKLEWHYYYTARSSYCPVVLTENGYISNPSDYNNIISDTANDAKADAIVKGIAEYFIKIQNP